MKKCSLRIVALAALVMAGCHSDFNPSPTIGVELSLHVTETIAVSDIQTPALSITVLSIDESRCPSDLECLVGGYVKVTFVIEGSTVTVGQYETKSIYWKGQNLKLKLVDVTPYPTSKNWGEKKTVIFMILH
jgi:hypothetical protein